MNVVEAASLGKRYALGQTVGGTTLKSAARRSVRRITGRSNGDRPGGHVWSLRDVDLEVGDGEILGIIGRNGSGKTTLLKLVSRITEPTTGMVRTRGRVGSILDAGTGFHHELTGRENLYLYGAILGLSRADITRRFAEIVEFAGVEPFLDTPVKRYSTGMYLRLAFSVAAHLEPDVLIVDEVLAVGDAEFQDRCLARMTTVGREGRTVLFVSHDLTAIARLCRRAVWLDQGRIQKAGAPAEVISAYLAEAFPASDAGVPAPRPDAAFAVTRVTVLDGAGSRTRVLRRDESFDIEIEFEVRRRVPDMDFAVMLTRESGERVLDHTWSDVAGLRRGDPGTYVARLTVPGVLNVGTYRVGIWAGTDDEDFSWIDAAAEIRLEGDAAGRPARVLAMDLPFEVRRRDEADGA